MIPLSDLQKAVRDGLAYLKAQEDVEEGEVYVAANGVLLARLNYTSHIPCNGVEEPKSVVNYGVGVQAVFKPASGGELLRVGFGSETSDISVEGVKSALEKARNGAVADPEFKSLARPTGEKRTLTSYHDPKALDIKDDDLVDAGWQVVNGALRVFQTSESLGNLVERPEELSELGLIVSGDVTILQERMALASYAMPEVQTDESSLILSFITSMVEREGSKGSGYGATTRLDGFTDEAGREAAENAIATIGGVRLPSGDYRVVFGRQATMEIMHNIVLPGLSTGMFYAAGSPFMGQMGQRVASDKFSIYDDGAAAGLVGAKGITCEGLPTGQTDLIVEGKLVGLLSNHYETQRLLNDPKGKEKLGVDPKANAASFVPRNGFRFARGGGRHFDSQPGIHPTNILIPGEVESVESMARLIGDGIYIGRIWYTYPVNGITSGDFSGTIIGDSYLIKNGKLAAPLKPNTVRMNDNVLRLINSTLGIATQRRATVRWSSDQVTWAPEIAVAGFGLEEISEFMESV